MSKYSSSSNLLTDPDKIKAWLKEMYIQNYSIDKDLTIHLKGNINFKYRKIKFKRFPVKFGIVEGDFDCAGLGLVSLLGAPQKVIGNFNCSNNQLTSLEGAPNWVQKDFYCNQNKLVSLKGGPEHAENYYCYHNLLENLIGAPKRVKKFNCDSNKLISLCGAPEHVEDFFHCSKNELKNFEGAPKYVGKYLFAQYNNIEDFNHIFHQVKEVLMGEQKNTLWENLENDIGELNLSMDKFNAIGEKEKILTHIEKRDIIAVKKPLKI